MGKSAKKKRGAQEGRKGRISLRPIRAGRSRGVEEAAGGGGFSL